MKRLVLLAGIVSSLALLASCYMMSVRPTGAISLDLGGPAGRVIDPTAQVRVYLYTYSSASTYGLYTFPSGKPYVEFSYGSGTQTLTGIPIGLWQVLASVGRADSSGSDAFLTTAYGATPVLNVTGGATSRASLSTTASPIVYSADLVGQNLKGVVFDYSASVLSDFRGLFAATAGRLYAITPSQSSTIDLAVDHPSEIIDLPSDLQINSLSEAYWQNTTGAAPYCVYINCNQGIIPYSYYSQGFDTSYSTTLTDSSGNRLNVLDAGAVFDPAGGLIVYYRRERDLGGVYLSGNFTYPFDGRSGAPWVKDPGFSGSTSNASVLDVAVDSVNSVYGYAYFATTAGAFRAKPSLVTYPNSTMADNVLEFSAPGDALIQAIAVDGADNVIYIGTSKGAYYAGLNERSDASIISGSWTPISETAGESIVSIKLDKSASFLGLGTQAVALRSRYNLYTLPGPPSQGATVTVYPFYAGLPGELNAMDFAGGTLFVAGSWGLASLPVGNIQLAY